MINGTITNDMIGVAIRLQSNDLFQNSQRYGTLFLYFYISIFYFV